jgi:hypothetical protein
MYQECCALPLASVPIGASNILIALVDEIMKDYGSRQLQERREEAEAEEFRQLDCVTVSHQTTEVCREARSDRCWGLRECQILPDRHATASWPRRSMTVPAH